MNRRRPWTLLTCLAGFAGCAPAAPPAVTATTTPVGVAPPPATTTVDPEPPQGLHLPRTALPTKYALELDVRTNDTKLAGTVTIDSALGSPTNVVWLHGRNLVVREARFETGNQKLPARVVPDVKNERLGFVASSTMPAGPARLFVRYEAEVLENADRGVFREQEGGDWYVFSQFENTEARSAFPCFDEPNVKTPWDITLEVDASQVALGNTRVVSESNPRPGRKTVHLPKRSRCPPTSSRSRWAPSSRRRRQSGQSQGAGAHRCAARGREGSGLRRPDHLPISIGILEDYFGVPYPVRQARRRPRCRRSSRGAPWKTSALITFFREGHAGQIGREELGGVQALVTLTSWRTSSLTSGSAISSPWSGGTTSG